MGIIARQTIKGTIANYFGIVIGFVTTFFVLTHYLTPAEVGLTRVLVDASVLFSSLALLGTNSSTIRFFPFFNDDSRHKQGLFFWTLLIPFIGFAFFLIAFFTLKTVIIHTFEDKSPLFVHYVYYTLPIAFFMLYMAVFDTNATILLRITVPKLIREVFVRLGVLVSYLLFGFHYIDLDGLVIAFCVIYGCAALLGLCYLLIFQKISFKPDFKNLTPALRRDFLLYTLFLFTTALVTSVLPTLSSFFISAKLGLTFTGIYAVANYIAAVIEVPARSLNTIISPQLSVAIRATPPDITAVNNLCKKSSVNLLLTSVFFVVIVWINIDILFAILPNGQTYSAGKWVVFLLMLNKIVSSTLSIGTTTLYFTRWYYTSLFFTISYMVLAVVLNNYFIPIYGIEGGAIATLASTAIYLISVVVYLRWRIKLAFFTRTQIFILLIGAMMLAINYLLMYVSKTILVNSSIIMQILESFVRTAIVCLIGGWIIYRCRLAEDINQLLATLWRGVRRKQMGTKW